MRMFRQRKKSKIISKEEMEVFTELLDRDQALKDVIKVTQEVWVGNRTRVNVDLTEFWKKIIANYKLSKDKDWSLNKDTGEVTEVKDLPTKKVSVTLKKEIDKNG